MKKEFFKLVIKKIKATLTLFTTVLVIATPLIAQQPPATNQFKIGIMGVGSQHCLQAYDAGIGCTVPYNVTKDGGNNNTSVFNVLSADGFNIVHSYDPAEYASKEQVKRMIECVGANNMQIQLTMKEFYKPSTVIPYPNTGTLEFGNCGFNFPSCTSPSGNNRFSANYDDYISTVFSQVPYKNIVWGIHVAEEAEWYHQNQYRTNCVGNNGWVGPFNQTGTVNGHPDYNASINGDFMLTEIPPYAVGQALTHYKTGLATYGVTNQKMVLMQANHAASINSNTTDDQGIYNIPTYLQLLNSYDARDVFYDGSYYQFPIDWATQLYGTQSPATGMFNQGGHYLGKFKGIDYEKNYASQVHAVMADYVWDWPYTDPLNYYDPANHKGLLYHIHSDPTNKPNADWLWFQTYTSIIHGVQGVWFWDFNSYGPSTNDVNNKSYLYGTSLNRFNKTYFSDIYQNFVSNLASEIRFLVNKNIISTDPQTIVATKTDAADANCIVPTATSYMASLSIPSAIKNENYGLRYTIRTNGTETWMIISNPLNVAVSNVNLNFSTVANPIIRNSTGVDVYFDNNANAVTSNTYKTNRNSTVDLINLTVGSKYSVAFTGNKQLTLSFGPLDVKVIKFNGTVTHYNNSWTNVWSNFGNGRIDGHFISSTDIFYVGDFDGGGDEELLCVQNTGGNNDWITLLKYDAINLKWIWLWSNYGSSSAGNGIYPYRAYFVVGDYDGDGNKELLGNDVSTSGSYTTLFKFVGGNWQWTWSDNGNSSHAMRPYKDKMYAGDFNGDGKDEILGSCLQNGGWTTIFQWNGSNFVWGYWSDNGVLTHPLRPYRTNLLTGDYNGDLKTDVLGFNTWSTLFTFGPSDWNWTWSTNGANNFAGWTYPLSTGDRVISGNIDNDTKDELMFLQNSPTAAWATTMDLFYKKGNYSFTWNWSGNPTSPNVPFIDDWSITPPSGASDTRYYFIKAKATEPKYLLAMRNQGCGYLVNMYKTSYPASNYKTVLGATNDANNTLTNDNSIAIYPNPAKDEVTVKFIEKNLDNIIIITDVQGKIVLELLNQNSDEIKVDTRSFKQGVYFVKVKNKANSSVQKLIID